MNINIEWRDIPGCEGLYQINNFAQVYNLKRKWEVDAYLHAKSGFVCVNLNKDGSRSSFSVHRLLVESFLGISVKGFWIRHKDQNKLNNKLDNLRFAPRKPKPVKKDFLVRFWAKVQIAGEDDCWLWTAGRNGAGYGSLGKDSRSIMAHRASWLIHFGEIPNVEPRLVVMHKCDNPPCVNPNHLELGTHSDNMQDALRKGRFNGGRKLRNPITL